MLDYVNQTKTILSIEMTKFCAIYDQSPIF